MPRWQDFENLAETIIAELQPLAEVKRNDFIDGHLSGTKRQIDVSIRWSSGTDNYLTIVQAKDTGRPADIKIVDEFLSVIRDVKATGGILICRSGFTGTAHTYARNCGIWLLNLHDAQSTNWSLQLTVPIIWIELTPRVTISNAVYFEAGDSVPTDDPLGLPLTMDDGATRINPISSFEKHWNEPNAQRSLGVTHQITSDKPLRAIVRDASGALQLRPVQNFSISYTVEQRAWLGQFQPADCRGLVDYLDQKAFTVSYLPFSEIPAQRDENWQQIEDPAAIAVSIRGTVVTTERIVVVQGGQVQDLNISYLGPDAPSIEHE
jgi:hypothetical protein